MQQHPSNSNQISEQQQQKLSAVPVVAGRTGTLMDMTNRNLKVKFPAANSAGFQMYTPYFTSSVHPSRDDPSLPNNFAVFEREKQIREAQAKLENEQKQIFSASILHSPHLQELLRKSFLFIQYHLFHSSILPFSINGTAALESIFYDLQKKSQLFLQIQFLQLLFQIYITQSPHWYQKSNLSLLQHATFLQCIVAAPTFALHECWNTEQLISQLLYNDSPLSPSQQQQFLTSNFLPLNVGTISIQLPQTDSNTERNPEVIHLVKYPTREVSSQTVICFESVDEEKNLMIFSTTDKYLVQEKRLQCWLNRSIVLPWERVGISSTSSKIIELTVSLSKLKLYQQQQPNNTIILEMFDAQTGKVVYTMADAIPDSTTPSTPQEDEEEDTTASTTGEVLMHQIRDCYRMNLISNCCHLQYHSLALYLYQTYCLPIPNQDVADAFDANFYFWAAFSKNQPFIEVLQTQSEIDWQMSESLLYIFDVDRQTLGLIPQEKQSEELYLQAQSNNMDGLNDILTSNQENISSYLQYSDPQNGNNCFHHAIQNSNGDMLRVLLDSAKQANLSTFEMLLLKLNKNFQSPLQIACSIGQLSLIQICLSEITDEEGDHWKDVNHYTPLACAILGQHIKIVKLLLDHFQNSSKLMVNQRVGPLQWNSLHLAIKMSNIEIAKLLLSKQVDAFALDAHGKQPYEYVMDNHQQFDQLYSSLHNTSSKIEKPVAQFQNTQQGKEDLIKMTMKHWKSNHFKWNVPVECWVAPEKYDISVRVPLQLEWTAKQFVEDSHLFFGLLRKEEDGEGKWIPCTRTSIVVEKMKSITFPLDYKCLEWRVCFKEEYNSKSSSYKLEIRYDTSHEYHILEAQGLNASTSDEMEDEAMIMDDEDEPPHLQGENWTVTKPRLLFSSNEFKLIKKEAAGDDFSLKRGALPVDPTAERPTNKQRV